MRFVRPSNLQPFSVSFEAELIEIHRHPTNHKRLTVQTRPYDLDQPVGQCTKQIYSAQTCSPKIWSGKVIIITTYSTIWLCHLISAGHTQIWYTNSLGTRITLNVQGSHIPKQRLLLNVYRQHPLLKNDRILDGMLKPRTRHSSRLIKTLRRKTETNCQKRRNVRISANKAQNCSKLETN